MNIFPLLLKSAVLLMAFYGVFTIAVRERNSLLFNRYYLFFAYVLSLLLPLVNWMEVFGIEETSLHLVSVPLNLALKFSDQAVTSFPVLLVLQIIYWGGVLVMSARFARALFRVWRIKKDAVFMVAQEGIKYYISDRANPAFSFFNAVYLAPHHREFGSKLDMVIEHEKAHIKQRHTFDLLFAQLYKIVFWFNPTTYLMQQETSLNHEYLADKSACNTYQAKDYFQVLFDFQLTQSNPLPVHSFAAHAIKKRIAKYTTRKTFEKRLAITLPFIGLSLLLLMGFTGISATFEKEYVVYSLMQNMKGAEPNESFHSYHLVDGRKVEVLDGQYGIILSMEPISGVK